MTAPRDRLAEAERIIRELVSEEPCWFDHNGGCQAHGYFATTEDEMYTCPQQDAKRWLQATADEAAATADANSTGRG